MQSEDGEEGLLEDCREELSPSPSPLRVTEEECDVFCGGGWESPARAVTPDPDPAQPPNSRYGGNYIEHLWLLATSWQTEADGAADPTTALCLPGGEHRQPLPPLRHLLQTPPQDFRPSPARTGDDGQPQMGANRFQRGEPHLQYCK